MHLVDSLLAAIVREDGESLVLHVGERPIVVAARGPMEVASAPMTLESMDSLLGDLLKADSQQALAEFGAVESELAPSALAPGEHFTVVAARGGDDIWIELRRRRSAASRADRSAVPASTEIVAALTSRPGPASSIPEPGVVLPMSRTPVRSDTPARTAIPRRMKEWVSRRR